MSAPFDEPAQRLAYLRGVRRGVITGTAVGWLMGSAITWGLFRLVENDFHRNLLFIVMLLGVAALGFRRMMER